jgi:hypothetical protein
MDFSKLKSDAYEFLALIIPGMLLVGYVWVVLRGWPSLVESVLSVSAPTLTVLILIGFGLGHILQELSDTIVKHLKNPRFFKAARDVYWASPEGDILRAEIKRDLGQDLTTVDAAFDYCLTKTQARFSKRDVFVATADFARAVFVLALLAVFPATRIILDRSDTTLARFTTGGVAAVVLVLAGWLSWRRMVRFREYSETPVFRAYLARQDEPRTSAQ